MLISITEFLDDETVASDHGTDPTVEGNDDETTGPSNKFWDEYVDRARIRGRLEGDQAESHYIETLLPLVTKADDYPLWKIACRVSLHPPMHIQIFISLRLGWIGIHCNAVAVHDYPCPPSSALCRRQELDPRLHIC